MEMAEIAGHERRKAPGRELRPEEMMRRVSDSGSERKENTPVECF